MVISSLHSGVSVISVRVTNSMLQQRDCNGETLGASEMPGRSFRLGEIHIRQQYAKLMDEQRARAADGTCNYEDTLSAAAERGLEPFLMCLQIDSKIIHEILTADAETSRRRCRLCLHPDKKITRSDAMNFVYTLAAAQNWV